MLNVLGNIVLFNDIRYYTNSVTLWQPLLIIYCTNRATLWQPFANQILFKHCYFISPLLISYYTNSALIWPLLLINLRHKRCYYIAAITNEASFALSFALKQRMPE